MRKSNMKTEFVKREDIVNTTNYRQPVRTITILNKVCYYIIGTYILLLRYYLILVIKTLTLPHVCVVSRIFK